jgi:DNA repair exonuclease SbcCD nuclease subunit
MDAVVTTDWHLDVLKNIFQNDPEQGIKLQMKDIEKTFEYAIENGIKTVIVPGDIGQSDELSSLAKFYFLNLLMKYDNVLDIYIIPGNHDYNHVGVHSLKLLELLCVRNKFNTVHLYTKPTKVTIEGEKFHFIPFPYANGIEGHINVAHIEPKDAKRDNGRKVTNGKDLGDMQWIIGHLHMYQNLKNAVLPGTLYQCNFGEKQPKGFVHIKVRKGVLKHKFIEIDPSFTFNTLEVEDASDWAKISKVETAFYRIYIKSSLTIPDEIYNYSNVLQISGKIIEASNDDESGIVSEDAKLIEDDDESLQDYLGSTYRFNKFQIKRSMALISEARTKIQ